ncbi:NUDIX domain-containing protein [Candidatus Woesearchaeota archaeon]|nr:NUDIX domain-containing protein [Candidatus Woesearchaeota archaeon]
MPHIHDKIDFCVEVFIVYNGKVLLRKHDKYKIWLSVGGHIELDEDPNEAAVREVKEEVGLDVEIINHTNLPIVMDHNHKGLIPPVFTNRHRISDSHEHVVLVYFAKSKTDKLILPITKEVSEGCKWFTSDELKDPKFELTKHVQIYANSALDALF